MKNDITGHKRRNFFIKKDFQGKYLFSYFLFVILGLFLFLTILQNISGNTLSITYDNFQLEIGNTSLVLFSRIVKASWIYIVTGGIGICLYTLFKTHKTAGPHFVFVRTLSKMIKGDHSTLITLRKKDEYKDLADKINEYNILRTEEIERLQHLSSMIYEAEAPEDYIPIRNEIDVILTQYKKGV